jgi:hypothetical protein
VIYVRVHLRHVFKLYTAAEESARVTAQHGRAPDAASPPASSHRRSYRRFGAIRPYPQLRPMAVRAASAESPAQFTVTTNRPAATSPS